MQMEILTDLHEMERLAPEWQELYESAAHRSLYNEPAFCLNWIKHYGTESEGRSFIIVVRCQGRLDAVLPLRLVSSRIGDLAKNVRPGRLGKIPIRQIEGLFNDHSDDTNMLVREGCVPSAAGALKQVLSSQSYQGARLGFFPSDSPWTEVLRAVPRSVVVERETRAVRFLRFTSTYEEYLAAHPDLQRKLRRSKARLERDFGPVALECWTGDDAVEKGFPAYVDVEAHSWKASTPGGESLANAPQARGYYEELTQRFARLGRAHVWVLRFDGITAGSVLSYESHGVLYAYKTSYKEMFATSGGHHPGLVMHAMIHEHAWPRFTGMDFMSDWFQKEWECETHPVDLEKRISLDPWRWLRGLVRNSSARA
jgi:hypothetical protein